MATARDDNAVDSSLPAGLYIVATPIGNLEDITLRALRVLREADVIACEDTRHTQKLLNHFEVKTPTQSYHEHNEAARAQELVDRISRGERIALVCDAGTPGISDPGERLVRAAVERGLNVVTIPGASALVSALVASGLPTASFRFIGFLPSRPGARRSFLENLCNVNETLIFYEAPHRILETLADVGRIFGKQRQIVIARELTKLHEEYLRGTVAEISGDLAKRPAIKGEMTVILSGELKGQIGEKSEGNLVERMRELMISASLDEKAALKQVAKEFGLSKSEAYREWQRRKAAIGTKR